MQQLLYKIKSLNLAFREYLSKTWHTISLLIEKKDQRIRRFGTRVARINTLNFVLKDPGFLVGFFILSFVIGFANPSTAIYDLLNRAIKGKIIANNLAVLALLIMILINFILIRSSLLAKYALKFQATAASLILTPTLGLFAYFGFWLRLFSR